MAYFDGDYVSRVLADSTELRTTFRWWQQKVWAWDRMVYPTLRSATSDYSTPPQFAELAQLLSNQDVRSDYKNNKVRTMVDTYINRMSRGDTKFEVAVLHQTSEEIARGQMLERFARGVINHLNLKYAAQSQGTGWERQVYASAAHPGKIIGRVDVKEVGGKAQVDWPIYDPANCYHDFGGPNRRFVHEYVDSAWNLLAKWNGTTVPSSTLDFLRAASTAKDEAMRYLRVLEHWVEEEDDQGKPHVWKTIVVSNQPVFHEETDNTHLPIIIVSMNTMARRYHEVQFSQGPEGQGTTGGIGLGRMYTPDFITRHAEPFFASLENTNVQYDELMAIMLDAVSFVVNPVLVQKSPDGQWTIGNRRLRPQDRIMEMTEQEIRVLDFIKGQIPQIDSLLRELDRDFENTFPSALRGQTAAAGESGYLYDLRTDQQKTAIVEHINGPAVFINLGMLEIAEQFKSHSQYKIDLRGTSTSGTDQGKAYYESFSAKDLPQSYAMNVIMAPAIPENEAQAMVMATQALSIGVSKFTIFGQILKLQDPQAEMDRADAETLLHRLPEVDDLKALSVFRDQIDLMKYRVQRARDEGRSLDAQYMQRQVDVAEQNYLLIEARIAAKATPTPAGVGVGAGPAGQPPQNLPPEAYANPDAAAAASGQVSSYTGGPPSKNGGLQGGGVP